jgi:autotransporter strand-loop-strand O-heptosyltransferase
MEFRYNFHFGACLEYNGEPTDPPVKVQFIDIDKKVILHEIVIGPNTWTRPNHSHFIRWCIRVTDLNDAILWEHTLDLSGKRVIIAYPYTTLGDFLCWMPVYERFRIEHNCHMTVQCSRIQYINSVCKSYSNIFFTTDYKNLINEGVYAMYEPSFQIYDKVFWDGKYPRYSTPQQVVSECFGLKHRSLPLRIDCDDNRPDIDGKYVCITEYSQSNFEKNWLYPNGWQTVANFLIKEGYKVVPISMEPTNLFGEGIINRTGLSITEVARYIKYADCVIGAATAAICIGIATNTPSISIITNAWMDVDFPIHFVYNYDEGCYGCYTWKSQNEKCDKKKRVDWAPNWIDVPECSLNISPDRVIEKIKYVLNLL